MVIGIEIKMSTLDFDKAIKMCEAIFDDPDLYPEEWEEVKSSKDFNLLSLFLKTHDIDNHVLMVK